MKALFFILWGVATMSKTTTAQTTEIIINVTGVDVNREGRIIVMIFGENGFPKDHAKALIVKSDSLLQETMTFVFDLGMEEMAVKVLHDENGDGKVTKNWTGIIPAEGLGFSNGQKIGITGPPKYKKSKLSRNQFENGLGISIKYPQRQKK